MCGLRNYCSEKHRYVARGLRSEISADGQFLSIWIMGFRSLVKFFKRDFFALKVLNAPNTSYRRECLCLDFVKSLLTSCSELTYRGSKDVVWFDGLDGLGLFT